MLIRHCTYKAEIAYDPANNGTPNSQAFSGIEINGVAFNLISNPYLDDATSIQNFLTLLGFGTIYYTFTSNLAQFISYNNQNIITKIFMIQDKTGAPISWEKAVDQSDCQFLQDDTVVRGCMDSDANNYNSLATEDDGSCTYTPTAEIDIIRCKAVDSAINLLHKLRKGELSQEQYDEKMKCLWWAFKGIDIYGTHIFVGDTIIDAVTPTAATTASVTVNFGAVLNTVSYTELQITINGVVIWSNSGDYIGSSLGTYASFQDFVDDIVLFINTDITIPDYTATNVNYVVDIESVATGSAQNGYPVDFTGSEIIINGIDIPTPGITPTFGCYDPDRQEIWFGSQLSHLCLVFVGSTAVGSVDAGVNTGDVIYNRLLQRKYCGLLTTQDILRIDNTNTIIPGTIPTGQTGTYYGTYNEFPATPQFAYTNSVPAVSNSISVFRADTEAQMGYSPIILGAGDDVLEITVNPQLGARQGFYYAALKGANQVITVNPLTGATGTFAVGALPICCQFIENVLGAGSGSYELWVGRQSNILERRDENGALIANITLPASTTCRSIRQNGGYVWLTSDGGAIDVLVIRLSDLAVICPNFECGTGMYGIVVNTDTSDVYAANPYDNKVVLLTLTEQTINYSTALSGGEDASSFTRDEVNQSESNNCTDDDDVNSMIQELKDGIVGCCD